MTSMYFAALMFFYMLIFIGFQIGQKLAMTKIKTKSFLIITALIWYLIKNHDTL